MFLIGITSMLACKGEQGDPRPAGVAGQDGTNGTNGNANIKNFNTQVLCTDWIKQTDVRYEVNLDVPLITDDILNTGLIMVCWREPSASSWTALPYSYDQGGEARAYLFEVYLGQIRVVSSATGIAPWTGTMDVRIIIASSDGKNNNPDLDWSDYALVKAAFDLED